MRYYVDRILFSVLMIVMMLLCVGCSESPEEEDYTLYINMTNEASRGIDTENTELYPVERIYWTYTARKLRGNYTTGQTLEEKAMMKNGPAPGFGVVGPFSVGVWRFEIFGYLHCEENADGSIKYKDMIYKCKDRTGGSVPGAPENWIDVTIDRRITPESGVQTIVFELEKGDDWDVVDGSLNIGDMRMTVPEDDLLSIKDGTETYVRTSISVVGCPAGAKVGGEAIVTPMQIARSLTAVTEKKVRGEDLELSPFVFTTPAGTRTFSGGVYEIEIKAEYKDVFTQRHDGTGDLYEDTDGWAQIGVISRHSIVIMDAVETMISGDINDIAINTDNNAHKDLFRAATAKILKTGKVAGEDEAWDIYKTLSEAVAVYGDTEHEDSAGNANPIVLIYDIVGDEVLTTDKDIVIKSTDEKGNRHFVNGLGIGGTGKITVDLNYSDSEREYIYVKGATGSARINNISYTDTDVMIDTKNVEMEISSTGAESVYHTGTADSVKFTAATTVVGKGYYLGTKKEGTSSVTSVKSLTIESGNLNMGSYAAVETLKVNGGADDVSVTGRTTTYVGNIDKIRDNETDTVTDTNRGVFKTVTLKANGGSPSDDVECYGIQGMYMNLFNSYTAPTSPAGLTFTCWNSKADRSGTDYGEKYEVAAAGNVLYAVWGTPVARVLKSDGTYGYYGTLKEAESVCGSNPIILLKDVESESFTPTHAAVVYTNGYKLNNLSLGGTYALDFYVNGDSGRSYKFSEGRISVESGSYFVKLETAGGKLEVYASADDVMHNGTISELTVKDCAEYCLKADADSVEISAGRMDIWSSVSSVDVPDGKAPVLKAYSGSEINVCKYAGTDVSAWSTETVDGTPYERIALDGNKGTLKVGAASTETGSKLYCYGVDGMEKELPDVSESIKPDAAPTGIAIVEWNTEKERFGESYDLDAKIKIGNKDEIYACWGEPVAKILRNADGRYKYYGYLNAACEGYDASGSAIELLRDVDNNGAETLSSCVVKVNTCGFDIVNAECDGVTLDLYTGVSTGHQDYYRVEMDSDGKFDIKTYPDKCLISFDGTGDGVSLDIKSHGNTYVKGNCENVTVSDGGNSKGANIGVHVDGVVSKLVAESGFVDLGDNSTVEELVFSFGGSTADADVKKALQSVVLRGRPTTTVGNLNTLLGSSLVSGTSGLTAFKKLTLKANTDNGGTGSDVVRYGLEGMYITLPVVSFTHVSSLPQLFWAIGKDGSGKQYMLSTSTYSSKIIVEGEMTLNMIWSRLVELKLLPLGGIVYFIDNRNSSGAPNSSPIVGRSDGSFELNSVLYYFFDADKKPIDLSGTSYQISGKVTVSGNNYRYDPTVKTLLEKLKSAGASYYAVVGKPSKDMVYVANNNRIGSTYFGGYNTSIGTSGNYNIGDGKKNLWIIFDQTTHAFKVTAVKTHNVSSSTYATDDTAWNYIEWLNGWSSTNYTNSGSWGVRVSGGCSDWYMPTTSEIMTMFGSGMMGWTGYCTASNEISATSCYYPSGASSCGNYTKTDHANGTVAHRSF